jgi:voltage-gated potassium channel
MIPAVRERNPLWRLAAVAAAFLVIVGYGTLGYALIAHYPPVDALFMTVTTITTVGFEEVHPLDTAGELFTITLIILGVITYLYLFSVLVEALADNRWRQFRRVRRMEAQIDRLRDHVIVCGYGRTGRSVCAELRDRHVPYVVIEMNPAPLEDVRREREPLIEGDAANDDVLQHAHIERARALVSAVDSDERNVYIVLTARSLNPRLSIVARSSYPDSVAKLERAGANRVVSPYSASGTRMAALAMQPAVVDVLDFVSQPGRQMSIEELLVPAVPGSLTARSLRTSGATILAVQAKGGAISVAPQDEQALLQDDIVVAMGTRDQLESLAALLQPPG